MTSESIQVPLSENLDESSTRNKARHDAQTYRNAVIGVFDTHAQAEQVIRRLEGYGL